MPTRGLSSAGRSEWLPSSTTSVKSRRFTGDSSGTGMPSPCIDCGSASKLRVGQISMTARTARILVHGKAAWVH